MKWGLARLVNNQGGRGFVTHDAYREFRTAEKGQFSESSYSRTGPKPEPLFRRSSRVQPKSCTMHLIARMSTSNGRLLYVPILCLTTIVQNVLNKDFRTFRRSSLLSLFSSIAAHSAKNGMPPRRLASLFSPYIFGLADDQTFDVTYREWQKATDATEHIILAYVCSRISASSSLFALQCS